MSKHGSGTPIIQSKDSWKLFVSVPLDWLAAAELTDARTECFEFFMTYVLLRCQLGQRVLLAVPPCFEIDR